MTLLDSVSTEYVPSIAIFLWSAFIHICAFLKILTRTSIPQRESFKAILSQKIKCLI